MTKIKTKAKIFACTQSTELAKKIAEAYGEELGNVITSTYSDGEFQPSFEESVRGARVFLIGSTNPGPRNLMEMLLMIMPQSVRQQDTLLLCCLILVGQGKIERINLECQLRLN